MRVTLNVILEEKEYAPVPGTEYDVGTVVKLKRPTFALRDEFLDAMTSGEGDDRPLAQMVTEGEWPEVGQEDPAVVARICEDFFCAATTTWRRQSKLRDLFEASTLRAVQSRPDGPRSGVSETEDGPK